jgi:hypothetical protein
MQEKKLSFYLGNYQTAMVDFEHAIGEANQAPARAPEPGP